MSWEKLRELRQKMIVESTVVLKLPNKFAFRDHDIFDVDSILSFFQWDLSDVPVSIDLSTCRAANYQALSLLALYAWKLKSQGCHVYFITSEKGDDSGASAMWRRMGAMGLFYVLSNENQQFGANPYKPLFAVRTTEDFKKVISAADSFSKGFNVEYENTLRYVLGELLYNTLEHGKAFNVEADARVTRIPSIVQFTWYKRRNEIHFIIADVGVGVKRHIEQAYPGQESDEAAIKHAVKAKVSGTFGTNDPYKNKNNAGMGLYISTNIIRRMNADMHVFSGNGLLHISPRDVTGTTLANKWPGTVVLVTLRIEDDPRFTLHKIMQEFRAAADAEQRAADIKEEDTRFYVGVMNYFGRYAEDKEAAIKFRDKRIFTELDAGRDVLIDFIEVVSSPHSFLSALLASPIKTYGLHAYKRIKIINATAEIRETIDFIFDDNT